MPNARLTSPLAARLSPLIELRPVQLRAQHVVVIVPDRVQQPDACARSGARRRDRRPRRSKPRMAVEMARASAALLTMISTSLSLLITIGRLESVCGADRHQRHRRQRRMHDRAAGTTARRRSTRSASRR